MWIRFLVRSLGLRLLASDFIKNEAHIFVFLGWVTKIFVKMFSFLFGKKEKQVAGAIINPTADLQAREDLLEKKIKQLEKIKESHHTNAIQQKALGKTNSALHFLKKEKLIEDEIATTNGMLLTIIQQRSALEQAYMNRESLQVLSIANKSIQESQKLWDADKVSDLVDDMEDTRNVTREINDLISGANRFYLSDEELLASLESEEKENNLVSTMTAQKQSGMPELKPESNLAYSGMPGLKPESNLAYSGMTGLTPDLPLAPSGTIQINSGSLTQIKNNNTTMLQELEAI